MKASYTVTVRILLLVCLPLICVTGCQSIGESWRLSGGRLLPRCPWRRVPPQWEPEIADNHALTGASETIQPVSADELGITRDSADSAKSARGLSWSRWLPHIGKPKRIPLPRTDLRDGTGPKTANVSQPEVDTLF